MLRKACWSLAAASGLYFFFLSLLLNGKVQRHALYAHKLHTAWWQDPNKPWQWGFLKNQIQPFRLPTPDGELLYAWHILPVGLYSKHENVLVNGPTGLAEDMTLTTAFELLSNDPQARLVISFHGNAGTVAQGWRTDTYRTLASSAADRIHVLTVDYRGFGHSTGSPTEEGLVTDGITLVKWAIDVAQIPPERIVIFGQSLGTAVSTAVAEHFAVSFKIEFAGVVLVAAFSDLPTLMLTYSIGNFIPILSPLRIFPKLQQYFYEHISDTWQTAARLANLVRHSHSLNLVLIHATNDYDIPWKHSEALFYTAANATSKEGMTFDQIDGVKQHKDLGEVGWVDSWKSGSSDERSNRIRQEILRHGGHNRVATYTPVARAIFDLFYI